MSLKCLVEADECTGYYADAVQELDKKQKHEFKVYACICTKVDLFI